MKPIRLIQFMILIMSLLKAFGMIAGTSVQASETSFSAYSAASVKTGVAFLFAHPPAKHTFPAELAGTWYTGALALTDVYDAATGAWRAQNGLGQTYTFEANGDFTYAAFLRLQTGMCLTEVSVYRTGKARAEGATMTLTPEVAKTRTVVDCGSRSDTTTDGPFEATTLVYDVTAKPDGGVNLTMTDNGTSMYFSRQEAVESLTRIGRLIP